ncbi:MAG: amidohydrolase family protein [Bacteroidales bacterium]|nr:amidohydrolase family protein [Bacteroidales bacterium]
MKKLFIAIPLCLVLALGIFACSQNSKTVSERKIWGGAFNPQEALAEQGSFDPSKYYVWYNGMIYTEANPSDFDYDNSPGAITGAGGKINSYLKARAMVTKDQFIECIADKDRDLTRWIADAGLKASIGTAEAPGPDAVWIDLKGATVIPGMIESHMHYIGEGIRSDRLDIFYKPKSDIINAVKAEADKLHALGANPNDTWIVSQGWANGIGGDWDSNPHPDGISNWPTRWELDAVSRGYPVALTNTSGHSAWYNTKALELGNARALAAALAVPAANRSANQKILVALGRINWDNNPPDYPDPSGDVVTLVSKSGKAIGVLQGNARRFVSVPGSTDAQSRAALYAAQKACFSYGITTIMDAGSGMGTFDMLDHAYQGMLQGFSDPLKLRIYLEIAHGGTSKTDEVFRRRMISEGRGDANGRLINEHGHRLTVRASKLLIDGAFGGQNAAMLAPYNNNRNTTGTWYETDETIYDYMYRNILAGWQTSVHVIGDAAVRKYNDFYEKIKNELIAEGRGNLVTDDRQRPEHYQIASLGVKDILVDGVMTDSGINDIQRSVDLGMVLSMQTTHATSDMTNAENLIGPDRIMGAYAWREVIDRGGVIAQGTDATVELLNPYHGLYAGVTRVSRTGSVGRAGPTQDIIDEDKGKFKAEYEPGTKNFTPESGWLKDQRLTRAEALHYSTWGGAYANFEEKTKGVLRKGYLADFVVIDRDYFDRKSCWDFEIKEINAVMTVLGGEVVYAMDLPKIGTELVALGRVGEPYSANLFASGTENFVWSIVNADSELNWVQIDEYRGELSGVPETVGIYSITIKAENYLGSDTKTLTVVVD